MLALMDEELKPAAAAGDETGASKPARRGSSVVMPAGIGLQAKLLADVVVVVFTKSRTRLIRPTDSGFQSMHLMY